MIAGTLEIMYNALDSGRLPLYVSLANWVSLLLLILVTCKHRKWSWLHKIVGPLLTALTYLYLSCMDYDYTMASIFYSMIIGFALSYFIVVIFNESWVISTAVYAPCLSYYMYKTGRDLLGSELPELITRCVFCVAIYGIIAYRIEVLQKQSFMGRESSEKAFHRWMKIFETFPEGIALIRNNYVLFANKSLKTILNAGPERMNEDDPYLEMLKGVLQTAVV